MVAKSVLRPQYSSPTINSQIKRLRLAMDTMRQIQFESSVSSIQDEFNTPDHPMMIADSSTPKKIFTPTIIDAENSFEKFEQQVNEEFDDDDDDDETILPDSTTPSDQSLASFRSAVSTNENDTSTSLGTSVYT